MIGKAGGFLPRHTLGSKFPSWLLGDVRCLPTAPSLNTLVRSELEATPTSWLPQSLPVWGAPAFPASTPLPKGASEVLDEPPQAGNEQLTAHPPGPKAELCHSEPGISSPQVPMSPLPSASTPELTSSCLVPAPAETSCPDSKARVRGKSQERQSYLEGSLQRDTRDCQPRPSPSRWVPVGSSSSLSHSSLRSGAKGLGRSLCTAAVQMLSIPPPALLISVSKPASLSDRAAVGKADALTWAGETQTSGEGTACPGFGQQGPASPHLHVSYCLLAGHAGLPLHPTVAGNKEAL